jgi:AraC-like DNA-binding protein
MRAANQHYWRNSALPFVELRSTYQSPQGYKPHFHAQLSFGAVLAGQTCTNCSGRERLLEQGDLVLIAPHVVHSCNPVAGLPRSYHMLYLDEVWCREQVPALFGPAFGSGHGAVIRDGKLFSRYVRLVANLAAMTASDAAVQLQGLLTAAAAGNSPAQRLPQSRQLGERIRRALLQDIAAPPSLTELAHAFGCREETLIRAFRRAFNTTPRAYVNNVRIELAKERLKAGDKIAHVAADLGFADQAQLHRAFVKYTASTPGQYRRARTARRVNFRQ